MKKFVPFALIIMVLTLIYVRVTAFRPRMVELTIGATTIEVDIADTIGKQRQGLSGRTSMPEDQGMYFPMGPPDFYSFWMKDMHFPLDIIWIRAGKVVDISKNVPYPLEGNPPASVHPKEPADAVLEVNAGFVEKRGVKTGDKIQFDK